MITLLTEAEPFPWLELLGRSHPVVLHLPLGLIPAMVLLEFGAAVFRRPHPRGAVLTLAWLCAASAGLATASGLLLASENGDGGGELIGNHKIAGIALGALCLVAAIAACFQKRSAFRIVLLLAFGVMVPTGHLGGSITHGEDFLFEPLHKKIRPVRDPATPTANGENGETGEPAPAAAAEYTRVIVPILERTCYKCHNPDKQKAELLLTTPEGILKGSEYGEVIVPGDPEKSELLQRLLLPIDHDDHMPPDGKPQPTAEEIDQLRAWIASGCKFE